MKPLAAFGFVLLAACTSNEPFDVFNTVPDFRLTSESGTAFESATALKGKVWVANFIFTTCTGPCPRMTSQMRRVQDGLAAEAEVRMVSFTVDPARDTPEVLAAYGKRHGADPVRWNFLTGTQADLHRMAREVFLLGNVDGKLEHSTRFVLIDRLGRIRRYYDSSEPDSISRLIADARRLVKEKAS